MDLDEIRKKLAEAGVPLDNTWGSTESREVRSPLVERQKANLRSLGTLLEQQLDADQERVADLHARLQMLKHGGGGTRG